MKVTSKGFEITDICPKINGLVFDGDGLRIDEGPDAHSLGLSADDVTKLVGALVEARRLMALSAVTPSLPRRLRDGSGDIWVLDANGETYSLDAPGVRTGWSRDRVESQYGPVTELPD